MFLQMIKSKIHCATVTEANLNYMGSITIDKEVIAQYAGNVATECFGIVGMGVSVKGGLVKLLKHDSVTKGIGISINNNKLTMDFHVIVAYGVSILAVSDNLISNVKYKVEEFTGIEVEKINIYVEDKVYQIKSDARFNALKYVNFFYHYKGIEKGDSDGKQFLGL